jgi:hypothetical protein
LNYSKRNREVVFTIVDISKAFNTIPHSAIRPYLARKGVRTPIIIEEIYNGCNGTITKAKDNIGVEIEILRGVKQGDPLSPLRFNLCLEPLLEEMGKNTGGININGGNKIPVLAFADHIVLLGKEKREAQNQPEGRASQIHEHIC